MVLLTLLAFVLALPHLPVTVKLFSTPGDRHVTSVR